MTTQPTRTKQIEIASHAGTSCSSPATATAWRCQDCGLLHHIHLPTDPCIKGHSILSYCARCYVAISFHPLLPKTTRGTRWNQ